MSRGPRANRPGSAHGVPFVGMRGSFPRAPACAGARFSGSRRRPRLLAVPLRRGWRPRWRGLHSHPLLLAVCVPTGRDPRPVPSYLRSLQPGVNRQCGGGCTALPEPRNRGARTSHSASPSNDRLQRLPFCSLPLQQECLWKLTFATNLERSKVFVPRAVRRVRLRFAPQFQLIEVFGRYLPICDPIEEVLTETWWKIGPPNLRHQSPNVIRASSSFNRCRSAESRDSVSRFTSKRNRSFSASLD